MGIVVLVVLVVAVLLGVVTLGTLAALVPLAITGLIVGAIARLLLPGRQWIGVGATIGCGIGGAIIGGLVAQRLLHETGLVALILQVACAAALIALLAQRRAPSYTVVGWR